MNFHLVQVNIAFPKYQPDDPRFAGFVDNLDRINALADASPGFVWRYASDDEDLEAKAVFADPTLIFNMSVWESRAALEDFVYRSDHVQILRQRAEWFLPQKRPTMALWWKEAGELPGITEARHRLDLLAQAGPTVDAFTFRRTFEPPADKTG
jgi:Domain of unknown function (DUF3291)